MPLRKKRISELTLADSLNGLFTIGYKVVGGVKTSVRVGLEYIQAAYEDVVKATHAALSATQKALTAASTADTSRKAIEANETERKGNEDARKSSEQKRNSAETQRATAEAGRVTAESQRTGNESARQKKEDVRSAAESGRIKAETDRVSAENVRVSSETSRGTAEGKRGTAETARDNAEKKRASSETARSSAETERKTGETERIAQEKKRVLAETGRAGAEKSRAAEFEKLKTGVGKATTDAIAAAGRVDASVLDITREKQAAIEASGSANAAAGKATAAAEEGNAKALLANLAAEAANASANLADKKAALAGEKAELAEEAAETIDAKMQEKINALISNAPEALDTLVELAAALGNDPNFAATVAAELAKKINRSDIIDDLTTGGRDKPASAETVKRLAGEKVGSSDVRSVRQLTRAEESSTARDASTLYLGKDTGMIYMGDRTMGLKPEVMILPIRLGTSGVESLTKKYATQMGDILMYSITVTVGNGNGSDRKQTCTGVATSVGDDGNQGNTYPLSDGVVIQITLDNTSRYMTFKVTSNPSTLYVSILSGYLLSVRK